MTDQAQHDTALDSDQQQVGELYAKALLASSGDAVDHIVYELEAIVGECLNTHPTLEEALRSPRIPTEQKEGMLDRIFRDKVHGNLLNFMKVLCRRGRIGELRAIQQTATRQREEQCGKMRITVTSAQPLSDDQRHRICEQLRVSYQKDPVLIEKVDPQLLGGIVLQIGDKVLDGSVNGKLDSIRQSVSRSVQEAVRNRFDALASS